MPADVRPVSLTEVNRHPGEVFKRVMPGHVVEVERHGRSRYVIVAAEDWQQVTAHV